MEPMRVYYGTKRVEAFYPAPRPGVDEVLTVGPYGRARRDEDNGYRIVYPDGYVSWSPKDVFEAAYRPSSCMGFEGALAAMREGRRVRRIGIDAEGVSIWLNNGTFYCQREGTYAGVWWPNPDSLLADWMIVEEGAEHTGWAG